MDNIRLECLKLAQSAEIPFDSDSGEDPYPSVSAVLNRADKYADFVNDYEPAEIFASRGPRTDLLTDQFTDSFADVFAARTMDFSDALVDLKLGRRVTRENWNDKDQWLELQAPDAGNAGNKLSLSSIYMKNVSGGLVLWLASQTDLLATDWRIV